MAADPDGAAAPAAMVTVEGRDHFADLRAGRSPLVAAFYGDWCGRHVASGAFLASVATETPATVARLDVEMHGGLAERFAIRSVPTVVVFHDGEAVARFVGRPDEPRLRRLVKRYTDD